MQKIPGHWTCQECLAENPFTETVCDACGEPFSESETPLDDFADGYGDYVRKGRE